MSRNRRSLASFFRENHKVALACSGGVDSTLLLHEAVRFGADILPIIINFSFTQQNEVRDAIDFCHSEGLEPVVVDMDVFEVEGLASNGPDRCYLCKRAMFGKIIEMANRRGYHVIIDGSNASDDPAERPGMRALEELGVFSPLREAGLEKSQVRRLARSARLSTWNKESNSCTATRIHQGTVITRDLLDRVDRSEDVIRRMGYSGFRVRTDGRSAIIELLSNDVARGEAMEDEIRDSLSGWFTDVSIGQRS